MELREYLQVSTDSRKSDRLKLLFFRDQLACDEFAQLWSLAEEIDGEDEALLLRGLARQWPEQRICQRLAALQRSLSPSTQETAR